MKKVFAVALCLVFLLTLGGCKKNKNDDEYIYGVDIGYYLSVGQIKESEFSLGDHPSKIEEAELSDEHVITGEGTHDHENQIKKEEGSVSYHYIYGPYHYYYNKGKEDEGISFIVSFDTAYGFSAGVTTKYEVSQVVKKLNPTEKIATEDDQFFMVFFLENCEMITCESGKYKLSFYFADGVLVCTTIENTHNWSSKG